MRSSSTDTQVTSSPRAARTTRSLYSLLACAGALLAACSEASLDYPDLDSSVDELVVANVSFRTVIGQRYIGAQNNGGGLIVATATQAQAWEKFGIDDING